MELQLGLALPSANNNVNVPIKRGLDLNINDFTHRPTKKRSFSQLANFEPSNNTASTQPWLLWNNQPNDDDDDDVIQDRNSGYNSSTGNEEDDGLVGWPPVKLCRKEALFHVNGGRGRRRNDGAGGLASSTFVKVKMEGVGIARKVDLSIHDSFQTLMRTLMPMFDKCEMDSNNYKLTYQDMEGDWLLADDQDVPWRTFTRSVQRLNLLKIEE